LKLSKDLEAELNSEARNLGVKAGDSMVKQAMLRAGKADRAVKEVARTATAGASREISDRARQVANRAARQMLANSTWLIPLFLVLALFLATLTARSLVRPINQLVRGTQALAAGDYHQRIEVRGDDELSRLALAFNHMSGAVEQGQAELQQSHGNLAAEKARIEGIVASSPDGLVMLEPTGQVGVLNPAAMRLLDLASEEVPVAPFAVSQLPAPAAQRLAECLERAQLGEGVQEYEISEPERRVLQLRKVELCCLDQGHFYGRLLHIHDITHERVVDEMKSDFISLVSHELRTPLTSILGFSSYMLTGRLGEVSETQRTALDSIHRQAKRLSAIISDFLDVSRIESGKIEMKKEPIKVPQIASRVVQDLKPQASEKSIRVAAQVEEGPYPLVALGDEQRIAQVFTNLVGNALKFTDHGAVDIVLSRQNGELLCKVRDTGCGIPPDELERVFDRFYQVEKVVTRKSGGTGLGLAIVKNIVEAHGGRIWIDSELGKGTEVTFTLPGSG
ncbi:MAG TPA: ATP-binding protein, partial [Armatimonadota bacterium]|nr:ATP-binding protein [Armatimonadota bacterium]